MKDKDRIMTHVWDIFGSVPRPSEFVCDKEHCDECLEHEETMQSLGRDHFPLEKLDNPTWDPICFASDQAFLYLVPGLLRLVLSYTDDYAEQFCFHFETERRIRLFTLEQRKCLVQVLDFLLAHEKAALENSLVIDDILQVKKKLKARV